MKSKLTTKDLIAAGAFAAIYLVLLTVLAVKHNLLMQK